MAKAAGLGLEITELRLGLLSAGAHDHHYYVNNNNVKKGKKRVFSEMVSDIIDRSSSNEDEGTDMNYQGAVVGWPPVCSYRKKNIINNIDHGDVNYSVHPHENELESSESTKMYVKISMDGAPFVRKIDLNSHRGYSDLATTFEILFGNSSGINGGMMREYSDWWEYYTAIYEDKDGDWMLVGDEPWEMFIGSCRRLRIMRRA